MALRIQLASDLHLEFMRGQRLSLDAVLTPAAPVLALLGDIHVLGKADHAAAYESFVAEAARRFERVLLLAGNHEFYSDPRAPVPHAEIIAKLHAIAQRCGNHVTFLHDAAVELDGVRVFGSTLWAHLPHDQTVESVDASTPAEVAGAVAGFRMMDYRRIFVDADSDGESRPPRLLQAGDTNAWHVHAVEALCRAAEDALTCQQNLVVLTHHAPLINGTSPPEMPGHSYGYSTDLSSLFSSDPRCRSLQLWAFGHTHHNVAFDFHGVRVVSNQRGYDTQPGGLAGLADGYIPDCVVEVPTELRIRPLQSNRPNRRKCALQ